MDPLELASIGAILLVFFLWGPQKIPELARAFGMARKEFDNATKEFQKVSAGIANGTSPLLGTPATPKPTQSVALPSSTQQAAAPKPVVSGVKSGDQLLLDAAKRLNITTAGKTREQIQEEIIAMAMRSGSPAGSQEPEKTGGSAA